MRSAALKGLVIFTIVVSGVCFWRSVRSEKKYHDLLESNFKYHLSEVEMLLRKLELMRAGQVEKAINVTETELLWNLSVLDTYVSMGRVSWSNDVKRASESVAEYCQRNAMFVGREDLISHRHAEDIIRRYSTSRTNHR